MLFEQDRVRRNAHIQHDDEPQDDINKDNEEEYYLVALEVRGGDNRKERGAGHPAPSLDVNSRFHPEFDHHEFAEDAQRGREHEESREE